jgi:hypothetical protein
MARPCTICRHPDHQAIDQALAAGQTSNTEAAIRRHKREHLPATLVKATAAAEVAHADGLLEQVHDLQRRALAILKTAEQTGDLRVALYAIAQARSNLELLARLLGELHDQEVKVNVLTVSPDWLRLRAAILTALDPHPAARLAVVEALQRVG